MLRKNYSKTGRNCKVTFKYPNEEQAGIAVLAGDFNDWNLDGHEMKRLKNGSFSVTLSLETGRQYRFRYVLDGKRWVNDLQADAYIANTFGSDDSVVHV